MSRKTSVLDRVSVKEPCREDWDAMAGNAQVRFCSHCAKSVHNLSQMARAEAERLIAKSNGRLCVRYVRRADASVATLPEVVKVNSPARRSSRLAASAFTAALAIATPTAAQSSLPTQQSMSAEASSIKPFATPQIGTGSAAITGVVKNEDDEVLSNVKVFLRSANRVVQSTVTDGFGNYRFEGLANNNYTIQMIRLNGTFTSHVVSDIVLQQNETKRINATMKIYEVTTVESGGVSIYSPAQIFVYHNEERELVSEKAEANDDVKSLLSEAADEDAKQLRVMISNGANVNAANEWNETALMMAARWGSVKSVKALLKAGADINGRSEFGVTALMYAMLADDGKIAQTLINAGADTNARDKDNRTALMFAAMEGRAATIKILLDAGAGVNARDADGKSPLKFAIENNQGEAIKVLRASGAVE